MIVITGAEGFIGSCLLAGLNEAGYNDIILVDDFGDSERSLNLKNKHYTACVERKVFFTWLEQHANGVQFVFHIGARTDTTEPDEAIFKELNLDFSKRLWQICVTHGLPLVYASSAATYGDGAHGYDDDESLMPLLKPLNPYGRSKNDFDIWAAQQTVKPYFWAGLKFFNVYGPNEYHKGRMASVVLHAYQQIIKSGTVTLFRSHRDEIKDGEQMRDFIYVKDLVRVCLYLMHNRKSSGIYNLGSGKARTFIDLVNPIFTVLKLPVQINFIDTPMDIRDKYQYFTEAKMSKLKEAGYVNPFTSLEDGVSDYVKTYLMENKYW